MRNVQTFNVREALSNFLRDGAGETALLVKCLLWKREGLTSDPQNPLYKPGRGGVCTAGLGMGWKKEESLQLIGQLGSTVL